MIGQQSPSRSVLLARHLSALVARELSVMFAACPLEATDRRRRLLHSDTIVAARRGWLRKPSDGARTAGSERGGRCRVRQDGSKCRWIAALEYDLDLIVTLDDPAGEIDSAFPVEEEGTTSSFLGLAETICRHGLFCALYTDRGGPYFITRKGDCRKSYGCPGSRPSCPLVLSVSIRKKGVQAMSSRVRLLRSTLRGSRGFLDNERVLRKNPQASSSDGAPTTAENHPNALITTYFRSTFSIRRKRLCFAGIPRRSQEKSHRSRPYRSAETQRQGRSQLTFRRCA
jgi:hypothetical protein